jgi:hypothetical protein
LAEITAGQKTAKVSCAGLSLGVGITSTPHFLIDYLLRRAVFAGMNVLQAVVGFVGRHPGILLVLIGVVGEVCFDWKEMKQKREWGKAIFSIILVTGLVMEFWEAAKSDKEVAEAKVHFAELTQTNLVLQKQVLTLQSQMSRAIISE